MNDIAKIFFVVGTVMIGLGAVVLLLSKVPWLGKLPGDILIKRDNFTFYFPLMTSLLVSAFLSLLFYLTHRQ